MMHFILGWLAAVPLFTAPLLLATTGLIVNEKAGVFNFGVEGIMAAGALAAAVTAIDHGNAGEAVFAGAAAGTGLSLLFGIMVVILRVDQVLAGLVTYALGIGVTGLFGDSYVNRSFAGLAPIDAAKFGWLPAGLAHVLGQDPLTVASFVLAILVWWAIERSPAGLRLRAVGEDAPAADAAGIDVTVLRLFAVAVGGLFCGLAGAHLSLVDSHLWIDGMIGGRGWIALALVMFARWNALQAIFAALLFGAVDALVPRLLSSGLALPVYLIQMIPYVITILVLIGIGLLAGQQTAQPQDLGRPFLREERR